MSKEERIELKRKPERIDKEEDSPMASISVLPNLTRAIPPSTAEEQSAIKRFGEGAVGNFDEAMM